MSNYNARTAVKDVVLPIAAAALATRGVDTLGKLQTLTLAEWWRLTRADFTRLAKAAALAGIQPRGGASVELLLDQKIRNNLIFGLAKLQTDDGEAISAFLTVEGVTSLMLASVLTRNDFRSIPGMEEPGRVDFLVDYLARCGARVARD